MRKAPPLLLVALASCLASLPARADKPTPPPATTGEPAPPPEHPGAPHDPTKPSAPKPDPAKVAAAKLAELIKRGIETCAGGDVDEGLPALRAAWAQHQDADLAVAVATCEIKASDWPSAAEHLAYALRNRDDPEQRKSIEATFVNVRARVGAVKVTVSVDGADVFVGDRFAGQSPLPGEVYVAPGRGRIFAKKTGYGEIEGAVDVKPNGTATLTLDLAAQGAVVASHHPTTARSVTPAVVLGVIGGVAVGVGAGLFAAGATKGSAANDLLAELQTATNPNPCPTTPGCNTLSSLRSGHDTFVNAGSGVLIGGGALVGAALIYGLWATFSTPPDRVGLTFSPVATPSGGGLRLRGTF